MPTPKQHMSDLSAPWTTKITQDPTATERPISFTRGGKQPRATDRESRNSLIGGTLATPSTIRAMRTFIRTTQNSAGETVPECVMLFSLGGGLNGFKDTLHGGINATLLDTLLGSAVVLRDDGASYMTRKLDVTYERPVKTPGVLMGRAWCEKLEGRKMWMKGRLEDEHGRTLTSAEGLWIRLKSDEVPHSKL